MELMQLYNQIKNPLDEPTTIEKLIQAYSNSSSGFGGFYSRLTNTVEKQCKGKYYVDDSDKFYSMMFNQWKKNVVEMTKERFITLRNNGSYKDNFIKMREFLRNIPDVKTKAEAEAILLGNYDKELEDAFENYSWNSLGAYSGWVHVCSRYITAKKDEYPQIEHRLYLNTESLDTYEMLNLLIAKMNEHQLPYYFKFDQIGDRDDTIVIYSDSQHLMKYIDLLNEIKNENPKLISRFKAPPVLTGKIDNWIGYGAEPGKTADGQNQSFNGVRSKAIETAISNVTKQWIMEHKTMLINYKKRQIPLQDYVAIKATEALLINMENKFKYKSSNQTDTDITNKYGYTLADIQSANTKNIIYNIIRQQIDSSLTYLCTSNHKNMPDIEIQVRNNQKVLFTGYDLSKIIIELSSTILKIDKNFQTIVKTEIINNSKLYGIDTDKYCFDIRTKENMKTFDANKNQQLKSEIIKKGEQLKELDIRKKTNQNEINKLYISLNTVNNKGLFNHKYQYDKLTLEIKIKELELKNKIIDNETRMIKHQILENQLKIDHLDNKINIHEYSFNIEQAKLNNSIFQKISRLRCNILKQEIFRLKTSLLDYAKLLMLIRDELCVLSQNKNAEYIDNLESENEIIMAEINNDYKKQIRAQIEYRFKNKIITQEIRKAQIAELETIKDFDHNTHNHIASITAPQINQCTKK